MEGTSAFDPIRGTPISATTVGNCACCWTWAGKECVAHSTVYDVAGVEGGVPLMFLRALSYPVCSARRDEGSGRAEVEEANDAG